MSTDTTDERPTTSSSALGKATAVLDALSESAHAVSVPEICLATGFNRQTVHRLLAQMEELHLVQRDLQHERFRLGARFRRLAVNGLATMATQREINLTLSELVEDVRETSNIGVFDGHDVVYLDRVECDWPLRVQLRAGSRVPAYCTAIGKLLLAHISARRLDGYLAAVSLKPFNENTITNPQKLRAHLAQIREQGFSINDQEDSVGLLAIAVPLRGMDDLVLGGLAIHGPIARLPRDRATSLVPRLQKAAQAISDIFGRDDASTT